MMSPLLNEPSTSWRHLAALHFVMHRRVIELLGAALGAVNVPAGDHSPLRLFWQQHSSQQIMRALSVFTAWNNLVRYKAGETINIPQSERMFRLEDLVRALEKERSEKLRVPASENIQLLGARETLQEALLLLHSCAFGLGPRVQWVTELHPRAVTLGVRYRRYGEVPPTLEALIDSKPDHWRAEHLSFELLCARDFLTMNGIDLHYTVSPRHCSLTFAIPTVRDKWTRRLKPSSLQPTHPAPAEDTLMTPSSLRRALQASALPDEDETQDAKGSV